MNLKNSYDLVMAQRENSKSLQSRLPYNNEQAEENERREHIEFQEEIRRDAEEKKLLLQAIVNEADASGCRLPSSVIRMMHSQNGKLILTFFKRNNNIFSYYP